MNRRQKIIVSVTGIFIVLLILVGLTYAYFLTKIKGNDNDKSVSINTADLKLEYSDINDILVSEENVEPGNSWTKTFAVTNNGNKTVTNYGVSLENIENGLERKEDLVYTLTCTQYTKATYKVENKVASGTTSGTCNGVSSETTYPSVGTILVENSIDTDKVQAYTLTVTYKETNTDQSVDMNKRFSGKVNIVDPKLFGPFGTDTLATTIINTAKNQTDSTRTTLGSEVTTFTSISGENEHVLNTAPDDYGTSYYFRGNVIDNYVSFADKTWRIVRINGDGSIRLILDDVAKDSSKNVIETAFNTNNDDNAYVGYMYGTPGSTTYEATHKNTNSSTIKTLIDGWYASNLVNYSSIIADSGFCGDRSLSSGTGIGTTITDYGAKGRLPQNKTPQFKCPQSNDLYTTSTATKGNKSLTYPVGLITADEVVYAGGVPYTENTDYYLVNGDYFWTMSPVHSDSVAVVWRGDGYGRVHNGGVGYGWGVRPAINLKSTAEIIDGGNGTLNNPYVIKTN